MSGNNAGLLLLGSVIFLCTGFSTELDTHYSQGLSAYENGQYSLAIQEFETILDGDWESSQLYYNLGNSYYRNGNIAGAVWAYEKCLQIDPLNKDAIYNLKLANLKVVDRVDIPEPPFYLKYYRQLRKMLIPSQWVQAMLIILVFLAMNFSVRRIWNLNWLAKPELVLTILLVTSMLVGANAIWDRNSIREGVIYAFEVKAYSAPNENSTQLFDVHEGLKVGVDTVSGDWVEIELIDGKSGWIHWSDIRLLN